MTKTQAALTGDVAEDNRGYRYRDHGDEERNSLLDEAWHAVITQALEARRMGCASPWQANPHLY